MTDPLWFGCHPTRERRGRRGSRESNFATTYRRVQVQRNLRRASASCVTTRAAIYLRISLDAAMDGLAIERQREDCEAIAKQRGWMVVYTYVD